MNSPTGQYVSRNRLLVVGIFIAIIAVIANAIFAALALREPAVVIPTPVSPLTSTSDVSIQVRYGFDEGPMGWVAQTQADAQAIIDVQPQIKYGESSLELQIVLISNDEEKSKGEVFVDLSSNPPLGLTAPLDLEGKPISMLVYVPSTAIGNPDSPNGIQVFVRDITGRSQYSAWMDLADDNTDRWTTFTLQPSIEDPASSAEDRSGAWTDEGFDPSRINIVGLKIGAGKTLENVYRGPIWIGGVDWP